MDEQMTNTEKPKKIIRIRVDGDRRLVEDMATRISTHASGEGFEILEQSRMIPNPFDRDLGRVFITVR